MKLLAEKEKKERKNLTKNINFNDNIILFNSRDKFKAIFNVYNFKIVNYVDGFNILQFTTKINGRPVKFHLRLILTEITI